MKGVSTREVVNHLQKYLGDCPQKVICRYLGVTTVALSQNIERPFDEILENKVGRRLDALLYLLECVKKDETLDAVIIHRLLTLPAFPSKDGWKLDVVSAIHGDYDKVMLVEVFQRAIELMRKPVDSKPMAGGLYTSIHALEA